MKILEISSATEMGGGEIHFVELVRELAARGHEVSLAVRPSSPIPAQLEQASIEVRDFGLRNSLDLLSAWRVGRFARERNVDVIHAHLGRDYPLASIAARIARAPALVLTRHHYLPLSRNFFYRWLLARASRLIAVSESVRQTMCECLAIPADRVAVIPNWIPDSGWRPSLDPLESRMKFGITAPFAVGMLSSIEPAKGVLEFVRAARILLEKSIDAEFLIGGGTSPAQRMYLRQAEKEAGPWRDRHRVRFLGKIESAGQFLSALDVVAVPSWNEAFSLVAIEGMASGKVVIATRAGGPAEIVEEEVTGFLVPPRDSHSLAQAIERVFNDRELRTTIGNAARRTALDRYSRSIIVDRVEELFAAALAGRGHQA